MPQRTNPPLEFASPGLRKALVRLGFTTSARLQELTTTVSDRKVVAFLADNKEADENTVLAALAKDLGVPLVPLGSAKIIDQARRSGLAAQIKSSLLLSYRCLPLWKEQNSIAVAFADPLDREAMTQMEFALGTKVTVCLASEQLILSTLERLVGYSAAGPMDTAEEAAEPDQTDVDLLAGTLLHAKSEEEGSATAPVITFVNQVLSDAHDAKASDVHVEPSQSALEVRYRVDGVMLHQLSIPKRLQPYVVTRLKILAGMDITEKRRPQDGRFRMRARSGIGVDVRASTVPTPFGEKVVLRLLRSGVDDLSLQGLAMPADVLQQLHEVLRLRDRMILVSGPTGSGKTTTLYSALNTLRDGAKNIITVEDPIEIRLDGITQIQVDHKVGMTFASGLRSILRQDPDIILVGEIRDLETAEIACQASQTGHLVLSTVHANSAPATITRLGDLGVPPFAIASSVGAIVAQRLVRRLCESCRGPETDEHRLLLAKRYGLDPQTMMRAVGCPGCDHSGYRGRISVYSLLVVDSEVRECIRRKESEDDIAAIARGRGMRTLGEAALELVANGTTSLEEAERVVNLSAPVAAAQKPKSAPVSPSPGKRQIAPADENQVRVSIEDLAKDYTKSTEGEQTRQQRVLFVDDDEGVRAVVGRVLRSANFDVCEAANGFEALDKVSSFQPDIIVSDLVMPGMDGRELVEELRKDASTASIPIIVLTGSDNEENEIELISLGANDFVSKGSSPALLIVRIRRMLRAAT